MFLNRFSIFALAFGVLTVTATLGMSQGKTEAKGMTQGKAVVQGKAADAKGAVAKMANAVKSTPESIAAGQKSYQTSCTPCHGATGKGDGAVAASLAVKPSNLVDDKWDQGASDAEIFAAIRDGIGPKFAMKAYKEKLKEDDIWNIVNFIRSIGLKK